MRRIMVTKKDIDDALDEVLKSFLTSHDSFKFKVQSARYNVGDIEHREAKAKLYKIIRERELRCWALALHGVQTYTDPMQPRGISPFRRLKTADEYINRELKDIAEELAQLNPLTQDKVEKESGV